jgi:hypothetical protein
MARFKFSVVERSDWHRLAAIYLALPELLRADLVRLLEPRNEQNRVLLEITLLNAGVPPTEEEIERVLPRA